MSDTYGVVVDVSTSNIGEYITADALTAATTLYVTDATTFPGNGGYVKVGEDVYAYSAIDREANSLTLVDPLVADLTITEESVPRVELYPEAPLKIATVTLGDEGDAVAAIVQYSDQAFLSDGFREDGTGELVPLEERNGTYYVKDVPNRKAVVNVENLPPEALLGASDGLVPDHSPNPVPTGSIGVIHVSWEGIENQTLVTYKVYISTDSGFTPDETNFVGETSATSMTLRTLTDETPFVPGVDYYVRLIAYDADGEAVASVVSPPVQLVQVTSEDIAVNQAWIGTMSVDRLTGGTLNADVITSGTIRTSETGGRAEMGPDGISVYAPNGTLTTRLGTDGDNLFEGVVNASGGLTVTGGSSFQGTDNTLEASAELELASTSTNPTNTVTVSQDWEQPITFTKSGDASFNNANITSVCKVGTQWVCGYRDGDYYKVYRFDSSGAYHSLGADDVYDPTQYLKQSTQIVADGFVYSSHGDRRIYRHQVMAANYTHVLTDDFNSAIAGSRWPDTASATWDAGGGNGRAKITNTGHIGTNYIYDHNNSFFSAKITRTGASAGQDIFFGCFDQATDSEIGEIYLTGSTLTFRVYEPLTEVIQSSSSITYNATTHAYWKIEEFDGILGFYTSSDGVNWTWRWDDVHDFTSGQLTNVQLWVDLTDDGAAGTVDLYVDAVRHGVNNTAVLSDYLTASPNGGLTVGNDATNVLAAYHDTAGDRAVINTIHPTTLATTATVNTGTHSVFSGALVQLAGVLKTAADVGTTRYWLKAVGSTDWLSCNTSGTFQTAETFAADGGGSKGIVWDGSFFYALGSNGKLHKHTDIEKTAGTAATVANYHAAYTWYDSNATGGTHETMIGGSDLAFTLSKRARINLTAPEIPVGAGGVDDPNSVRFYTGASTAALKLQVTTAAGVRTATITSLLAVTSPPGSNNFLSSTAAKIKNATGSLDISGAGSIATTQLTSSGPVSGTTGTFSGAVSTGALSPTSLVLSPYPGSVTQDRYTAGATWNKPAGARQFKVQVQAGGGAGGGAPATAAGQTSHGAGGQGGAYAESIFDAASIGSSVTVTVGSGGTGVSGAAGNNGGTSSFGAHVSAAGGDGASAFGPGATGVASSGAQVAQSMTGQIQIGGGGGGAASRIGGSDGAVGGHGGNAFMGNGGAARGGANPGNAGTGYGGGGGGATNTASLGAKAGGAGAGGIVIVTTTF